MPELLLGIDVGTGSSKAVLTDLAGTVLSTAVVEHETSMPRPGWHEHDADDIWWSDTVALCSRVFEDVSYAARDVCALAVSAIGPCLLPLDARDRPLRPGILYGIDTRASAEAAALTERMGADAIESFCGMQFSSQAIGPKMAWLQQAEPDVWRATRRVTTASSYIVLRLTGEHVIDRHTAAHFMPFMEIGSLSWSERYADVVPGYEMLPRLGWPCEIAGHVTASASASTGLQPGTPVAVGTVDAASEALAVGVRRPGDLMVMYGSTMFFVLVTSQVGVVPGAWLVGGLEPSQYNVAAGMATAGSLTEWCRSLTMDGTSRFEGYAALFVEAETIAPGADGLLLLPYFEGERTPINDPYSTGGLLGLTLRHHRAHLMRAVLEGVAYGARHNLETMADAGTPIQRVVAVGGGTTSALWVQVVSDVCGVPQIVPAQRIGASYGDAFIAGVAAGHLTIADNDSWVVIDHMVEPTAAVAATYDAGFDRYRRFYEQTKDLQHELSSVRTERASVVEVAGVGDRR